MAYWSFSILLDQLVFPTYDKIAREVEIILETQALRHQSEIDQLTNKGKAKMPNDHADLPDLNMEVDQSHQSMSLTADPLPPPSDTNTTSWKPVLTKNQKNELKKQEKRAEKNKFLQEAASLTSSTASPGSTLDGHKPILSQLLPQLSASAKRSDKSDDKIASLTTKKRKNESSTGDNGIIITGYQPEENDKNLILDLAAITNIPEDMTIESLFPKGTSGPFINESNLQSFKIVQEQDGTRILIGYFTTWEALSYRRQPKTIVSGSNSFSFKKAGSSLVVTGSNCTPLESCKLSNNNNKENNTNSLNLAHSQKSSRRLISSNTNKESRKSGNGQSGNLNKNIILKKLVVDGAISLILVDLFYAWYLNKRNEYFFNNTIEKEHLKQILQPDEDESSYYVIYGEHGTGKTTLAKIASKDVGQGVIYVEVPSNLENIEQFGIAFGKSFNFAFEKHISFTAFDPNIFFIGKIDERPKWKRALEAFKRASAIYKAKYNKTPVIVYNNINKLANINSKALDTLQDDAKMYTDYQEYIAVFITSEGSVLRKMRSRSVWSRAERPIEISDLSKEKSIKYLTEKHMINETKAEKLYDLKLASSFFNQFCLNKLLINFFALFFAAIKKEILHKVEIKFKVTQLLPKQLNYEAEKKAIKALFNSKKLEFTTFMEFFDNYEEVEKVLQANVFSYHPESYTVTFQSQSVETFIQEKADTYVK
ncbi:P-loop containing nucleoside triphosphate hydrolase protein [Rhizophagus clarus]|uniref:P-loop containing nucleoside triphosphate hydrolase protein n=1 Tax=Rhizophagus clarus TaxID=94130 RepID=A0A8H3LH08_9GLOM|nr:P-loop containing nucleoside triphosphate hydrolase protein [Rhizophagus clarus]